MHPPLFAALFFGCRQHPFFACSLICGSFYYWPSGLTHFLGFVTVLDAILLIGMLFVSSYQKIKAARAESRYQRELAREIKKREKVIEEERKRIAALPKPSPPPPAPRPLSRAEKIAKVLAEHEAIIQRIDSSIHDEAFKRSLRMSEEDRLAEKLEEIG